METEGDERRKAIRRVGIFAGMEATTIRLGANSWSSAMGVQQACYRSKIHHGPLVINIESAVLSLDPRGEASVFVFDKRDGSP